MKRNRIVWVIVVFVILTAGISFLKQKEPVDWRSSYSAKEKIPFGTFIVYDQLDELGIAPQDKNRPLSEWLPTTGNEGRTTLMLLAEDPELGEVDSDLLLEFVAKGNVVFLAAERLPPTLLSKLDLAMESSWKSGNDTLSEHMLVHPTYKKDTAAFTRTFSNLSFQLGEYFGGRVLGIQPSSGQPDFISQPYGRGVFYLHLAPKVFTNIHILENPTYASRCLSYLPVQETIWDEYYKPMARLKGNTFQAIKDNPALAYAWKLIVAGMLLGILFYSKRKQRPIPILPKPENKSLEFIETIGDLYLHNGRHHDLATKKTGYFYQHVRERYHLSDQDPDFWKHLEMKSAVDPKTLKKLRQMLQGLPGLSEVGPEFLLRLNQHLESFYNQTGKYHTHE